MNLDYKYYVSMLTTFLGIYEREEEGVMEKDKSISFELRETINLIKRDVANLSTQIIPEGLTGLNLWILGYLYCNRDKDIFQRDFEEQFKIRRSTTTNVLKTMEKKGLIRRISVDYDGRLKKIELTDKSLAIHEKIERDIMVMEQKVINGLTEEEIITFCKIIDKIKNNLE